MQLISTLVLSVLVVRSRVVGFLQSGYRRNPILSSFASELPIGPSGENGGYDRWNKWSTACLRSGIRLEDCTRQPLGTFPQDDEYKNESEYESGDERSDDDSGEWVLSESYEKVPKNSS